MGKEKRRPAIQHFPMDIDFIRYLYVDQFEGLRKKLRERSFTTGNSAITYRVLGHWDKNGLLPRATKSGDRVWRKFSFVERVWLEVVKKLRDFGLPLEEIADVRKNIMRWNKDHQTYTRLEYFIVKAAADSLDPYIVVFSGGEADIAPLGIIEASKGPWGHDDMLLVSVKSVLNGMGMTPKEARQLLDLTEAERELLSEVRQGNNDEIRIKLLENGKIKEYEATELLKEPPQNYEAHKKAVTQRMYGHITYKYEDGRPRSMTVMRRKRFAK